MDSSYTELQRLSIKYLRSLDAREHDEQFHCLYPESEKWYNRHLLRVQVEEIRRDRLECLIYPT